MTTPKLLTNFYRAVTLWSRLALRRAAANLPWVDVLPQEGANVYSILQRDVLVRQG